mmetsp:Transcript_34383/g.83631  ORF Transcript_34383/g.83631 Transcript_34383/m.83631 type:complete len:251 (-) Transcript_34383:214-966(-)
MLQQQEEAVAAFAQPISPVLASERPLHSALHHRGVLAVRAPELGPPIGSLLQHRDVLALPSGVRIALPDVRYAIDFHWPPPICSAELLEYGRSHRHMPLRIRGHGGRQRARVAVVDDVLAPLSARPRRMHGHAQLRHGLDGAAQSLCEGRRALLHPRAAPGALRVRHLGERRFLQRPRQVPLAHVLVPVLAVGEDRLQQDVSQRREAEEANRQRLRAEGAHFGGGGLPVELADHVACRVPQSALVAPEKG